MSILKNRNIIAIDLAKNSLYVVAENKHGAIVKDKAMTVDQLRRFLARQPHSLVAMEACGSAHHWTWFAEDLGHEVKLLPPQHVVPFREGHKTDQTDTFSILEAAKRPKGKEAVKKSPQQLGLQTLLDIRERYVDQKRRYSNAVRGHLLEFGIRIRRGYAALDTHLYEVLEDADNGVPHRVRALMHRLYQSFQEAERHVQELDKELQQVIREVEPCQRLSQLEGVGPVAAISYYARIGDGRAFRNGRETAAWLGSTPQQYSTGGHVNMGHIRKRNVDRRLRATLLQGAMSVVAKLANGKPPGNQKMRWLKDLIDRRGPRIAAVALLNKNTRTAWAMLRSGEEYVAV